LSGALHQRRGRRFGNSPAVRALVVDLLDDDRLGALFPDRVVLRFALGYLGQVFAFLTQSFEAPAADVKQLKILAGHLKEGQFVTKFRKTFTKGEMNDDLLLIVRRVEALSELLETEDGKNLLAGTKRAANILAIEEKKGTGIADAVDPALLTEKAEKSLFEAVNQAEKKAGQAIQAQDFSAAMRALAALREPVDSFFEEVLVNVEEEAIRANRLALLARIRAATGQVADFSKIAG
jgi:glycyl-tRNA synthetase beta subunit